MVGNVFQDGYENLSIYNYIIPHKSNKYSPKNSRQLLLSAAAAPVEKVNAKEADLLFLCLNY